MQPAQQHAPDLPHKKVSPEEYLAFERAAEFRHEYRDGEIVAMSGGTRRHSHLSANCIRRLGNALDDRPCQVHTCDMRIKAGNSYTYPDFSVVCSRPILEDEHRDNLLNPFLIGEVLSKSTEAYDRGEKFARYRQIESLRHYILVSQREVRIEQFVRRTTDSGEDWLMRVLGPGEVLVIDEYECEVAVDDIYRNVFDTAL